MDFLGSCPSRLLQQLTVIDVMMTMGVEVTLALFLHDLILGMFWVSFTDDRFLLTLSP